MGTYCYLHLKNKAESNIKRVNNLLDRYGIWPKDVHNGVDYGAFVTKEQLKEDVRFMNEDPVGLKQAPGMTRPISFRELESLFWNGLGTCVVKLSGGTDNDGLKRLLNVVHFCSDKKLIDTKASRDYTPKKIKEYIE